MGKAKGAAAVLSTAPAYTFGHSSNAQSTTCDTGPGPGAYQPKLASSNFQRAKGVGFGTSGRVASYSNKNPAPGEYNPCTTATHKRSLTASIQGKESYDPLRPQQPGPGQYAEVPAGITHPAPAALSISQRLEGNKEAERRPAPGEYNPDYQAKAPVAVTIKHKRGAAATDRAGSGHAVPGPGTYRPQDVNITNHRSPAHTMGGSRLSPSSNADKLPGPGAYSPYLAVHAPAGSFGRAERHPASHYEVRPDPGSYFTHNVVQRPAGHSVESLHRSSPAATMGVRQSGSYSTNGPGPGDYGIPKDDLLHTSHPTFTLKGVASKEHVNRNPAPGHYSPERSVKVDSLRSSSPEVSITHRHPDPASYERRPAPGEYECTDYHAKSPLPVTIKHKRNTAATDRPGSGYAVPGPGEYVLQSSLGGPAHTIAARLGSGSRQQQELPGPGQYEVHESTIGVASRLI